MPKKTVKKSVPKKTVKTKVKPFVVTTSNIDKLVEDVKLVLTKPYYATLRIMGRMHESSGSDLAEVMSNFKIQGNVKSWGLLKVTHGEVVREKILPARFIWQYFNGSRVMKEMALKNILIMINL